MTNVITSISTVADKCVDLPDDLKCQRLVVFYPFFRQWTGCVSMTKDDYSVGTDGSLPPDEVTANYGQKRVIDPKHLRIFDAIKKRAETVLAEAGLPFCKGTVVPVEKAAEVEEKLTQLAQDYNAERDDFVANLQGRCQDWMILNPKFAARLTIPSASDIRKRIDANFSMFQFQPVSGDLDKGNSMGRAMNGLFDEVLHDVAKRSKVLLQRSVQGKSHEDMSQKTLSVIKLIRDKLYSLQFLNSGVKPLMELVNRLLSIMPTKGKFTPEQFNVLSSALVVLSDESTLLEVAQGRLTLEQFLNNAMPHAFTKDAAFFNNAVSRPVAKKVDVPKAEPVAVVESTPVAPPVVEVKPEAQQATTVVPVPRTPEPEVKKQPAQMDIVDLEEMLKSCFNDSESGESKVEAQDAEEVPVVVQDVESQEAAEEVPEDVFEQPVVDIPPAPDAIQLSPF